MPLLTTSVENEPSKWLLVSLISDLYFHRYLTPTFVKVIAWVSFALLDSSTFRLASSQPRLVMYLSIGLRIICLMFCLVSDSRQRILTLIWTTFKVIEMQIEEVAKNYKDL